MRSSKCKSSKPDRGETFLRRGVHAIRHLYSLMEYSYSKIMTFHLYKAWTALPQYQRPLSIFRTSKPACLETSPSSELWGYATLFVCPHCWIKCFLTHYIHRIAKHNIVFWCPTFEKVWVVVSIWSQEEELLRLCLGGEDGDGVPYPLYGDSICCRHLAGQCHLRCCHGCQTRAYLIQMEQIAGSLLSTLLQADHDLTNTQTFSGKISVQRTMIVSQDNYGELIKFFLT